MYNVGGKSAGDALGTLRSILAHVGYVHISNPIKQKQLHASSVQCLVPPLIFFLSNPELFGTASNVAQQLNMAIFRLIQSLSTSTQINLAQLYP